MPRKRRIQIIGKRATFNVEAWARAVEALTRQLQREAETRESADNPKPAQTEPEAGS
jgi:hypothetical protein